MIFETCVSLISKIIDSFTKHLYDHQIYMQKLDYIQVHFINSSLYEQLDY
jgi:hypothetical protein